MSHPAPTPNPTISVEKPEPKLTQENFNNVSNREFLEAIFGPDDWGITLVTSFTTDPADASGGSWTACYAKDHLAEMRTSDNQYFAISLFRPDEGGTPRRRETLHESTHCLVIDDVGNGPSAKVRPDTLLLPEPSWRLETSRGNEQWGYILTTPENNACRVNAVLSGLVKKGIAEGGGDPGMLGVTRYVRLPGGSNTKRKYFNGSAGFKCVLTSWNPDLTYTLEQLAAPYSIDLENLSNGSSDQPKPIPLENDPVVEYLKKSGRYLGEHDGEHHFRCFWIDQHTDRAETGTSYRSPGLFSCHHKCSARTNGEWWSELGRRSPDTLELLSDSISDVPRINDSQRIEPRIASDQSRNSQGSSSDPDYPGTSTAKNSRSHTRDLDIVSLGELYAEREPQIVGAPGSNWIEDGSIDSWFEGGDIIHPPARDWIFHEVLPAGIVAIIAGAGGVGKGRWCLSMAVAGATGTEFGPLKPISPGTWIILGKEDDREEQQRRLVQTVRNWPGQKFDEEQISHLKQNLIIPEIQPDLKFGPDLVEELGEFCDRRDTKTQGIIFDPYSRFCDTTSGFSMNSQEGAAESHNWLAQIQQATNSTVVAVHHFNQSGHQDIQNGRQMNPTQITGNMQITDFSRLVIQLGIDSKTNGLNARGGRIINVQVTKSNYTMLPDEPWKFEILEGGAIVPAILDKDSGGVRAVVKIIAASKGNGITRDGVIAAAKSKLGLPRQVIQDAITTARSDGSIKYHGIRNSKGDYRLYLADSGPKSAVGSDKDSRPGGNNHAE